MQTLKWVVSCVLAICALVAALFGSMILAAFGTIITLGLAAIAVVWAVAALIKECFSSKKKE